MDSDDEVATRRYQQTLDFGPVDDSEITKIEAATLDSSHPDLIWGYPSSVQTEQVAKYQPTRLVRRRTTPPMGRAPRRACNARTRGSRRTRTTSSSSDDPGGLEPPDELVPALLIGRGA
jgi:hypothetical protein